MQINKKIILFLSFLMVNICVYSQNYSSAIGFTGGYVYNGAGVLANYNYYNNPDTFYQVGLFVSFNEELQKNQKIKYNDISLNVGYFKNVFESNFKNFKVNVGGGLLIGYESVNEGKQLTSGALILDESKFIYGAFASAESEIYLNNNLSFIIKYNQFYHHNSDLGNLTFIAGVGLRYFLY